MKTFKIERCLNMVVVTDMANQIWKAWDEEEFTERKLNNYIKKLNNNFKETINIIK